MPRILARPHDSDTAARLAREAGLSPVMARVMAARGIRKGAQLERELAALPPFTTLPNAEAAAERLADAIARREKVLVVADYDADGATACAVAVLALRELGAEADYLVPNRFEDGYGLTPEIARQAAARSPRLLLTVDNGVASVDGVAEARRLGMDVLVTDHHLPGESLPDALIVDPNAIGPQPSPFAHLAGVGVVFYVMLALRAELRRRGAFTARQEPNLARLLDLVALGTVADVVRLDEVNRILVSQGLRRVREGRARPGIAALFRAAGRDPGRAVSHDLGFVIGPRLNAAGRLDDMALGIECLLADDPAAALESARRLDSLNRERREIEAEMQQAALASLDELSAGDSHTLCLFEPDWHQGVIGLVASRLKERFHRPTVVLARGNDGTLKGSGRSIPGFHLRDALDRVAKRHPELFRRFGGHAMAAGLTLRSEDDLPAFAAAFETVAQEWLTPAQLERVIETDGPLAPREMDYPLARSLGEGVWGQGFPEPTFHGEFDVVEQRVVGERHRKLRLGGDGGVVDAILFHHPDPLPARIQAVYALSLNEYNGTTTLQLTLRHWEPA